MTEALNASFTLSILRSSFQLKDSKIWFVNRSMRLGSLVALDSDKRSRLKGLVLVHITYEDDIAKAGKVSRYFCHSQGFCHLRCLFNNNSVRIEVSKHPVNGSCSSTDEASGIMGNVIFTSIEVCSVDSFIRSRVILQITSFRVNVIDA